MHPFWNHVVEVKPLHNYIHKNAEKFHLLSVFSTVDSTERDDFRWISLHCLKLRLVIILRLEFYS